MTTTTSTEELIRSLFNERVQGILLDTEDKSISNVLPEPIPDEWLQAGSYAISEEAPTLPKEFAREQFPFSPASGTQSVSHHPKKSRKIISKSTAPMAPRSTTRPTDWTGLPEEPFFRLIEAVKKKYSLSSDSKKIPKDFWTAVALACSPYLNQPVSGKICQMHRTALLQKKSQAALIKK
ncbi:MAG: hypothetical protein FJZ63_01185 [Chlamydiae bacterium]|nr:hypothetical protein [Chlamydiota bacterium]